MDLDVVFLGTSGSAPTARRSPPALLVRRGGDRLLFDCGEGTQRQLLRSTVGLVDLREVFLTHLHGDHYFGLPMMLKTFALRDRDVPLTVYGPSGLVSLFDDLARIVGRLPYRLELVEVRPGEKLERGDYKVLVFPATHGVPAVGYALVEDERPGRFDVETADTLGVPNGPERGMLQRGEPVTLADGRTVSPDAVLGPARPGRAIVYPGDTAPSEVVRALAENADLLVHEASFGDDEVERAADTAHTTARQAAELARDAGVRLLALTHITPRYFGPELLREAREVFEPTVAPRDFDVIEVPFRERGEPTLVKGGAVPERRDASADPAAAPTEELALVATDADDVAPAPDGGFDRCAARYDELRPVDANWWQLFDRLVERGDLRGARVLELGCGTGRLAQALEERALARVWAVDASTEMVARAKALGVNARVARAEALPFKRGWFDAAVTRMAVHLFDRPRAFAEVERILAPAGRLAIATRAPDELARSWLREYFPSVPELDAARFPDEASLRADLATAGFGAIEVERLDQPTSITRERALEVIRAKAYSTLELLPTAEYERGLARAEAEQPELLEYRLDWLVAVATRTPTA